MSIFKKIKRRIKPYIKSWQYYRNFSNGENAMLLHQDLCDVIKQKEQIRTRGLKLIDDYVDTKKKSDTIFIFGSGESVNYLTGGQWDEVKRHNTMAFNYFLVHDFVPDYYEIEIMEPIESHRFFENLAREKYSNVDMFVNLWHANRRKYDFSQYPYQEKMWVFPLWKIPAKSNENFRKSIRYFNKRKMLNLNIVEHISQTCCVISLAYLLGYKNIVLIGVDLNGTRYFTHSNNAVYPSNPNYERLNIIRDIALKLEGKENIKNHGTMIPDIVKKNDAILLSDWISIFNEEVFKPEGIKLFASSEKSKLAEFLSVYFK